MNKILFYQIIKPFKNKYLITIVVFLLWMIFFDSHNMVERYNYYKDIMKLKQQKTYYQQKITQDKQKLNELKTNSSNLEKFAREQYFMKKDDEDIFIVDEND